MEGINEENKIGKDKLLKEQERLSNNLTELEKSIDEATRNLNHMKKENSNEKLILKNSIDTFTKSIGSKVASVYDTIKRQDPEVRENIEFWNSLISENKRKEEEERKAREALRAQNEQEGKEGKDKIKAEEEQKKLEGKIKKDFEDKEKEKQEEVEEEENERKAEIREEKTKIKKLKNGILTVLGIVGAGLGFWGIQKGDKEKDREENVKERVMPTDNSVINKIVNAEDTAQIITPIEFKKPEVKPEAIADSAVIEMMKPEIKPDAMEEEQNIPPNQPRRRK